jgi:hypothetical protein
MKQGKKFLSDLKLFSDYLKWLPEQERYETWEDACDSIIDGHRQKYNYLNLENYLKIAEEVGYNTGNLIWVKHDKQK